MLPIPLVSGTVDSASRRYWIAELISDLGQGPACTTPVDTDGRALKDQVSLVHGDVLAPWIG